MIAAGDLAPDFALTTDAYQTFRLSGQRGRIVVLYFYPEDDSEGCTIENIEFTDQMPEFGRLGVVVLGISPDSVEKHCNFRDKYSLAVPLAADPGHRTIEAYGMWVLKKLYGREFMGVKRVTVLVGRDGRVAGVFHATRIRGHAAKVLEAAAALAESA